MSPLVTHLARCLFLEAVEPPTQPSMGEYWSHLISDDPMEYSTSKPSPDLPSR